MTVAPSCAQDVRENMGKLLRRTSTRTRVIAGALALALVAGAVYWFVLRQPSSAAAAPEATTQSVAASLGTVQQSVTTTATLTPSVQEEVSFAGSGTVTAVDVQAGDTVEAGQALATIDTLQLDAAVLSAKADLAEAQATLADSQDSSDGSAADLARISADQAQVEVAQSAVTAAEAALAGATLTAPAAGLVTEVNVSVGQAVTGSTTSSTSGSGADSGTTGAAGGSAPGATSSTTTTSSGAAFVIVGTDAWEATATVGDSDLPHLAVGNQVELTVDGLEDTVFGTVATIGLLPSTSSGTATYPVTISVTGSPEGLHDGVTADAEIIYERRTDVLTVPSAAVRTVDGESVVTQAGEDGEEVTTVVTVGETTGSLVEITSGLEEGDEVLVQVVQRTETGTGGESGQTGQMPGGGDFDPSQVPEGFDPSQMGGPGGQGGGQRNG
ncbi:efflux RND transporter periplasmic adaptor subunit [Oerskovia sp. NPDC060287]|uniref:efflux RND transporter periplasmic adaptor subunit n=1 Tax=Oerskovia sp. NPDC060287 TaxID=3347095 RepID=UPI00365BE598